MLKLAPIRHRLVAVGIALALLIVCRSAAAVPVSYTANLNTSMGQPVTDIMILETDGTQTFLDYPFNMPGTGITVLTHDVPFSPTKSLILGLTPGIDKTEIVMLLNHNFAQANVGRKFSEAFPNTRHNDLISRLTAAESGDNAQLDWFRDTFFPGDGAAAAFDTGGPFSVAQFSTMTVIGASATFGGWDVNSVQDIPAGGIGAESNLATSILEETATDPGPFDVEFQLRFPGSIAIDKSVLNNSGAAWTNFELILGTGLGDQFIPSTAGDNLSFLSGLPNREDTGAFPGLIVEEDRLLFSGFLAEGNTAEFVAFVSSLSGTLLTVRQLPTLIPEPSSSTLAFFGLMLFFVCRRNRPQ